MMTWEKWGALRGPQVALRCLWWRTAVALALASEDMRVNLAEVKCQDLKSAWIYLQCVRFSQVNEISFQSKFATRKQSFIGFCNGVGYTV